MRYHYQKPDIYLSMYGELYICNHPVYDRCTLFTIGNKGLAVIQQRFSADTKSTYWTEVDSWLTDSLYLHPKFKEYFDSRSGLRTPVLADAPDAVHVSGKGGKLVGRGNAQPSGIPRSPGKLGTSQLDGRLCSHPLRSQRCGAEDQSILWNG